MKQHYTSKAQQEADTNQIGFMDVIGIFLIGGLLAFLADGLVLILAGKL